MDRLDYVHGLSSQLAWQDDPGEHPIRLAYTSSGQPTAAILRDDSDLVENVLFWVTCESVDEAHYLLAIINSDALTEAVEPLMPKGQFGSRHLHKHLWKLPIPEFDAEVDLHAEIAAAGEAAAAGAAGRLAALRKSEARTWG